PRTEHHQLRSSDAPVTARTARSATSSPPGRLAQFVSAVIEGGAMRSIARSFALLALVGGLVGVVASPAASRAAAVSARRPRCKVGVTFKAESPTTPRQWW